MQSAHVQEVRPRKDHRSVDLIFCALPFGRLRCGDRNGVGNATHHATFFQPIA